MSNEIPPERNEGNMNFTLLFTESRRKHPNVQEAVKGQAGFPSLHARLSLGNLMAK